MKAFTTERIAGLLRDAAAAMRGLLKDTATAGDSDDLRTIAEWIAEVEGLTMRVHPVEVVSPSRKSPATETPAPDSPRTRKPPVKREPRFEREGDALVKIAWSKKNRAEYEHKASRDALARVMERVEEQGRRGKMFRMEDVLPVLMTDGAELPSYQAYLCVGWLKTEGLLEQHGRQGYTIPQGVTINKEIERAWAELHARGE